MAGAAFIGANIKLCAASLVFVLLAGLASLLILRIYNLPLDCLESLSLAASGAPVMLCLGCFAATQVTGWLIPAVLISLAWVIFRQRRRCATWSAQARHKRPAKQVILFGGLVVAVLFCLMLVKFGYVSGLAFPLNSDSVIHADLIRQLLANPRFWELPYYHYGFHYVIVVLSRLTGNSIPATILVFGQVIQFLIPLGLYFPVHRIAHSQGAALLCVWIAGIGWNLPSQAASWGKHPALMALTSAVFVFTLLYWELSRKNHRASRLVVLALITWCAMFIHSRMLILLVIGLLILLLDVSCKLIRPSCLPCKDLISHLPFGPQLFVSIIITVLLLLFLLSQNSHAGTWQQAILPYLDPPLLPWLLLALLPIGLMVFPVAVLRVTWFILLALLFSTLPNPPLPAQSETLLDRPFLSMLLFLPLTLLYGLEFAGLGKLSARWPILVDLGPFSMLVFALLLLSPNPKILAPLPNASLVSSDDLRLYPEITRRLPVGATIAIPAGKPYYELGLDGGAWIAFATGHPTVKLNYAIDLSTEPGLTQLCDSGARYVYLGSRLGSFRADTLVQHPDVYRLLIDYPQAKIYMVIGCAVEE